MALALGLGGALGYGVTARAGRRQEYAAQAQAERLARAEERAGRVTELEQRLHETRETLSRANAELASTRALAEAERGQAEEKLTLLRDARDALALQFRTLANEILEEKSRRFTEQNQTHLGQLLDPLRERMTEFRSRIEEIHGKDIEQQTLLKAELARLHELNRQMTEEAHGLTVALKGQAKKQGNWGELVLGNVLDRSGLREGADYAREVSFETEDGRRRPDVVISLPQGKHLVIDAKVSLNAYTRYVNAEDDTSRELALREHIAAMSSRIQELSDRKYFQLPGLRTPEMVFMFVPVESAFAEALRADDTLFQRAIEQNVLVATPTTLLTSLNIVRQLWRFEEQNAHARELAKSAAGIHRKLVTFVETLQGVGAQLGRARESWDKAMNQLATGRGNLIRQAQRFEELGVPVQGDFPEALATRAALELDHPPDLPANTQDETVTD